MVLVKEQDATVGKKKRPDERKESRFELRSETAWMERIEKQAARFGLTVTGYIRLAVTARLEQDEATDPRTGEGEL